MIGFVLMRFHESTGRWPFMKAKAKAAGVSTNAADEERTSASDSQEAVTETKGSAQEKTKTVTA